LTGEQNEFQVKVRFDAQADIRYYRHQGILPMVIRKKTQSDGGELDEPNK
jgi:aconitate hydratase